MAESPDHVGQGAVGEARPARPPNWRALAPVAALGLGAVLLVGGIVARVRQQPRVDAMAPLIEARQLIEQQKHQEALDLLNGPALALVEAQAARGGGAHERRELLRLRARALFLGQQALGQDLRPNNRAVVDDYLAAEKAGAELTPVEVFQLAWSQVSLGEIAQAVERTRTLPAAEADLRRRLVKRIVERELAETPAGGLGLSLLAELLTEPGLSVQDRAWAVARQAELQIEGGHASEAVSRLLRELQQLHNAPGERRAELHTLLARAYLALNEDDSVRQHLDLAAALAEKYSPLRATIGVLFGRLHEREPNDPDGGRGLTAAKERYAEVLAEHPGSDAAAEARFGLARVEAALAGEPGREGGDQVAVELFAAVIEDVKRGRGGRGVTKELVREALVAAAQRAMDRDRVEAAVKYAVHAESLDEDGKTPAEVLLLVGRGCRRLAEERLAAARPAADRRLRVTDLDRVTREEIKLYFQQAARAYRSHAMLVRSDVAQFTTSLWESADCFDRAGEPEEAKRGFSEYVEQAPAGDPRRSEAVWRLAQVFQAERQYAAAAEHYRRLVDGRLRGAGPDGSGKPDPWGDKSIVPLAQCLLRDDDPLNDEEAERLLRDAVSGRVLSREAVEFRDGLVELGRLYYAQGRYGGLDGEGAIPLLTEAVDRYPDDREADSLLYMLADSYRLSATAMGRDIESEAMPQSVKEALRIERRDRLVAAMDLFQRVRRVLEARDPAQLTALQRIQLRNSCFYLGDVAFDLAEYDPSEYGRAIEFYDAARQKYDSDPSSLVAMVQIVNAYVAQGRWDEAEAANRQARQQLDRLPPEVWQDPDLPMERRHWERWLEASSKLERRAAAGENDARDPRDR